MTGLFAITLEEQAAEIRRELQQRAFVYPRLVASKRLSADGAARQTDRLKAALATIERLMAEASPPASAGIPWPD